MGPFQPDRRHNLTVLGTVTAPGNIRFSPFVTLRSGQPYDVLAGEDLFGDTLTNVRAEFAGSGVCSGVVRLGRYGLLAVRYFYDKL